MRTTVDIPDPLYRRLKSAAAAQGRSVKSLVLQSVKTSLDGRIPKRRKKRVKFPLIRATRPGSLRIDNKTINELLFP
jgi:hypothetical protein